MCAGRLSRMLLPMPTTTHKEHWRYRRPRLRSGAVASGHRLAAVLNPALPSLARCVSATSSPVRGPGRIPGRRRAVRPRAGRVRLRAHRTHHVDRGDHRGADRARGRARSDRRRARRPRGPARRDDRRGRLRAASMAGLAPLAHAGGRSSSRPCSPRSAPLPERRTRSASSPCCRASSTRPTFPPPTPPGSGSPASASSPARCSARPCSSSARPPPPSPSTARGSCSAPRRGLAPARGQARRAAPAVSRRRRSAPTSPAAGARCAPTPTPWRFVGADVIASAVYGALTVVLVLLADRLGLCERRLRLPPRRPRRRRPARLGSRLPRRGRGAAQRGPLAAALLAIGVCAHAARRRRLAPHRRRPRSRSLRGRLDRHRDRRRHLACSARCPPTCSLAPTGSSSPACIAGIAGGALLAPLLRGAARPRRHAASLAGAARARLRRAGARAADGRTACSG